MDVQNEKKDISTIIKLVSKYDHSDRTKLEEILNDTITKEAFCTEYGERYLERISQIYQNQQCDHSCVVCQQNVANDHVVCSECKTLIGQAIGLGNADDSVKKMFKNGTEATGKAINQFTEKINTLAGGEGAVNLRVRDLFSNVFKKHSAQESEEIFICGTEKTTPTEESIMTEWPRPWLYTRVGLYMFLAFYMLVMCFSMFQNINVLPGIMIIGSMVVPFAVLIFFFEVNAPRNISIFSATKIFCVGGCASLLATLILFEVVPVRNMDFVGAILVGIIEEVGKLIIIMLYIKRRENCNYLLNGLLIGAAVGAGFAAFESAGYAFNYLVNGNFDQMMHVIYMRGFLAPGGHVTWAAMSGFAIMLVKRKSTFEWEMLKDKKFWSIFTIPIIMHAVWDMPFDFGGEIPGKQISLIVIAWIFILVFIHNGLNEINKARE